MARKICVPKFQIDVCDNNRAALDQKGLQAQSQAFNVPASALPLTWSIKDFQGDIENVSVDADGLVTYDAPSDVSNNGIGFYVVEAKDACNRAVCKVVCTQLLEPISDVTLACNNDLRVYSEGTNGKFVFNGLSNSDAVYSDLAKTALSQDGDPVFVWEDGNGNGDVTVRSGNNPPTLDEGGSPNGNNALVFNASNRESVQYDVPNSPPVGAPFKIFFLVKVDPSSNDTNACVMSSTSQGNNNLLGPNTWQFSRSTTLDIFCFRLNQAPAAIISGSLTGGGEGDMFMAGWDSGIKDGAWHLVYASYDGTTVKGYFDGAQMFEVEPSQPLAAEHFKFGENRAGGNFISMSLAELQFADNTMTEEEATEVQAYYLCKYGLDASQLTAVGPYSVEFGNYYNKISQFRLQTFSNGDQKVYDTVNNQYYEVDDVPTVGLGLFRTPEIEALLDILSIQDSPANAATPVYTDNAAALAAGLALNSIYRTPDGDIRAVV